MICHCKEIEELRAELVEREHRNYKRLLGEQGDELAEAYVKLERVSKIVNDAEADDLGGLLGEMIYDLRAAVDD